MNCAALIYPHQNIRYRESLPALSKEELRLLLLALEEDPTIQEERAGNAVFLLFSLSRPGETALRLLHQAAGVYLFFTRAEAGLVPLLPPAPPYLPDDFASLLKYKGKTNERFTGMMLTMALALSAFARQPSSRLLVCDPMGGKGTTAFLALSRGWDAVSLDSARADVREAADYVQRYLEFHRLKHKRTEDALTLRGAVGARESRFILSDTPEHYKAGDTRTLRLLAGDTRDLGALLRPESAHLLVTDLPYGVQKGSRGGMLETVRAAMPGWVRVLRPGGALAMSFNALVTKRAELLSVCLENGLIPAETGDLRHRVEQAIERDVILARKSDA